MKKLIINPFIIIGISTILIVGCIVLSLPLYYGFLTGIIFTMVILIKSGYDKRELFNVILTGLFEIKHLCLIIIMIGATTSIWLSSGVVPTIMYYGFTYMEGLNFLLAAFLIMVFVSIFMGTAVGTISTVGISLLGIGLGLGIPIELMVGVLISGAFVADKISPLSGLVNLTITTVNRNYKEIIMGMLPTLIPALIITSIIYFVIGLNFTSGDYSKLIFYKASISEGFNTSLVLISLPLIVLTLSVLGFNSLVTIGIGLVVGTTLSIALQHMTFLEVLRAILFGYHGNTPSVEINNMLVSGGVVSMIEVIFIVAGGVILVKIFEKSNILMPIINKLMAGVNSRISLIVRTGFISSMLTVVTCDQTVGIILPGKVLQDKYKEFNLDNTVLARTISDTGTIIAPLMAWNVNSFIIKPIVGISANLYAPYAVLCYICPIITIVITVLLYRNNKS